MDDLIALMKNILASAFSLYFKTHVFHWNVESANFPQYHEFFKEMYEDIWNSVDDIAERLRQLDAYVPPSLERFLQLTKVESEKNDNVSAREMILKLYHDNEIMILLLTEGVDLATKLKKHGHANFLAERIEHHSKFRWMLRATAKKYTNETNTSK